MKAKSLTEKRMTELLPCPHCGKEVLISGGIGVPGGEHWISCKCQDMYSNINSVVQAWNTRTTISDESQLTELKEQLANAEGRNKMLEEDLVIIGNLLDSERERCRRLGDSLLNRICESLESPSDTAGSEGQGG